MRVSDPFIITQLVVAKLNLQTSVDSVTISIDKKF